MTSLDRPGGRLPLHTAALDHDLELDNLVDPAYGVR